MIQDILNTPQKAQIEDKTYLFEFDHFALANLEKSVNKSAYEIYDILMSKNALTLNESISMIHAGMIKHHCDDEIVELTRKVQQYPGLFKSFKESLVTAFILPMSPPEILREFCSKKKALKTKKKK